MGSGGEAAKQHSDSDTLSEDSYSRGRKGFFGIMASKLKQTPGDDPSRAPKTRILKRCQSYPSSGRKKRANSRADHAGTETPALPEAQLSEAAKKDAKAAAEKAAAEKELMCALSPGWFESIDTGRLTVALEGARAANAHDGLVRRAEEKLAAEVEAARKKAEAEAAKERREAEERAAVNVQAYARGNSGRMDAKNEAKLAAERDAEEKVLEVSTIAKLATSPTSRLAMVLLLATSLLVFFYGEGIVSALLVNLGLLERSSSPSSADEEQASVPEQVFKAVTAIGASLPVERAVSTNSIPLAVLMLVLTAGTCTFTANHF